MVHSKFLKTWNSDSLSHRLIESVLNNVLLEHGGLPLMGYTGTLGRKANSKNFHDQTSAIPIRNPEDMWIPKMCDIKSVHGPHFEL